MLSLKNNLKSLMKKLIFLLVFLTFAIQLYSKDKPKLIVGIVVDQMRYDYVYRFWDNFDENGLKKLVNEGYFFRNTKYNYMPTYTGPGHASIFTGTTPAVHGIIANSWYDKTKKESVYCAGDGEMHTICNCENQHKSGFPYSNKTNKLDVISNDGQMSPHHMLSTTIGDELKLFNNDSKVIGISLKDRGAILPAGHMADAAYWMDRNGEWISSSYYMEDLPRWMIEFQNKNTASNYMTGNWKGNNFNYSLDSLLLQKGTKAIKSTPQGNTILKDLAKEIINQENLGQDENTDIFTISFSATDYVGHEYGPHAEELVDTYTKLDKDLADLLKTIEKKIGKENVVIFLTSDHGVVSVPNELIKNKIPAGYFLSNKVVEALEKKLNEYFGLGKYIEKYKNQQFFLNSNTIKNLNLNKREIEIFCSNELLEFDGIKNCYTSTQMNENEYTYGIRSLIQKGYNQKRSGDILINLESGWIEWNYPTGTTHGSCYSYDTHVPLIFWGKNIKHSTSDELFLIQDIAPTISNILGISYPSGCTGIPIRHITE